MHLRSIHKHRADLSQHDLQATTGEIARLRAGMPVATQLSAGCDPNRTDECPVTKTCNPDNHRCE